MTESIISFETAKLAEKKGFQELCLHYYNNGKLHAPYLENGSSTDVYYRVDLEDLLENHNYKHLSGDFYSAPTQALLQKWLRELHNFHIIIIVDWTMEDIAFMYRLESDNYDSNGLSERHATYEQALEAGLIEALNMLK